jgi:colanic acid/amylovoran biosynthesis glycosyltransferase
MRTIAYITNQFPTPVEPYVVEEISELRRRGVSVIPCSARRPSTTTDNPFKSWAAETLYLQPLRLGPSILAVWSCLRKSAALIDIIARALVQGRESPGRRLRAVLHTFLGAYLAVLLEREGVDHIHVHHGYFACWIAMVAARLRGITYSVTLHGSDLLLHKAYLAAKLANCQFCTTISEFNRRYILDHYSGVSPKRISPEKIFVRRMGVASGIAPPQNTARSPLVILAVGRLHRVKNHAFLIEACARLKQRHRPFACLIAGEGEERQSLQLLIENLHLEHEVILLGHLSQSRLDSFYANSNVVALTSRSEGLPLSLMEAMAREKIVLAPAITGIPELVIDGKTGFLFREGSMDHFLEKVEQIRSSPAGTLQNIRRAARETILRNFDRHTNLAKFIDLLLQQTTGIPSNDPDENFVLQQI